jgi:hypothetical protein
LATAGWVLGWALRHAAVEWRAVGCGHWRGESAALDREDTVERIARVLWRRRGGQAVKV